MSGYMVMRVCMCFGCHTYIKTAPLPNVKLYNPRILLVLPLCNSKIKVAPSAYDVKVLSRFTHTTRLDKQVMRLLEIRKINNTHEAL